MTDAAARARALDPGASFIVRAPAGSGKTELLIQRYLKLLTRVEAPESIVAITFTRKAAAEMRARVLEALRSAAGPEPQEPHKAITWTLARSALEASDRLDWRLLENPARIGMQTIDSLCASIARQMPLVSGFGAMPEIVEHAESMYAEAARMTLLGRDCEHAIECLLLHLNNEFGRVQLLVASMLEKRDQWLRHVGVGFDAARVRAEAERCLRNVLDEEVTRLRRLAIAAGESDAGSEIDAWKQIAGELLTREGKWRARHARARLLEGEDELREALHATRELPDARFSDSQWRAMEAIVAILPVAVGNLRYIFRERGCTDFVELTLASLRALGEAERPSDLGLALGYKHRHILLDEFQDTSLTQYALLERLVETWEPDDRRTLFLVGDPMQSIYRFRQAEVGLFLKAWNHGIGPVRLEPLNLTVNFRSTATVVDWVNHAFGNAFPARENIGRGAVSYTASIAASWAGGPEVCVHAFIGEAAARKEAERVTLLADAGRGAGTVAILVRARTHLPEIIAALKRGGIPYQAIEIDELGERAVIQDLMALTFALIHLADRISWLAVLRAPWCGLSLEELYCLAGADDKSTIWDLLLRQENVPARVQRIVPVLEQALSKFGRMPLRNLVEETWIRLGGPACVENESDLENAAAYFDLIEQVEEGGDLGDFGLFRDRVAALFAQPDTAAEHAVQIMTIHKAKGLEFDTVILPGAGEKSKNDDSPLMLWHEPDEHEVLFAAIPEAGADDAIYKYLQRIEKEKAGYEAVRLLYVAATRARSELHLCGRAKRNNREGTVKAEPGSFLNILWPSVQEYFAAAPDEAMEAPQQGWVARPIRRLVESWRAPEPPPPVHWIRSSHEAADQPDVSFRWVGETLRHAGTVVHAYLQRIAREGLERWTPETIRANEAAYRTLLASLGVPPAEQNEAAERVIAALLQTIADPRGRWILAQHAEAECELSLSGVTEGVLYRVVIDRTFVDEGGVRWIVDYKTSAHEGGSVAAFVANEKLRYQEQLERYARLMAGGDARPVRLGLYFPLISGWVEWPAPAVKTKQASLFAD